MDVDRSETLLYKYVIEAASCPVCGSYFRFGRFWLEYLPTTTLCVVPTSEKDDVSCSGGCSAQALHCSS
ncbi:hypothetical protein QR680_016040 [Steinernema hermaphroditum]|uniref:Uncharacterized protein n=1 Tax=Steinernema hermaphroditum TaxID=289476 RepID=A0AA39H9U5_9BILA|nr:hypothetical protein QR680_016040 [Steinernema hermaphroditum]